MTRLFLMLLALPLLLLSAPARAEGDRAALVIGMADYQSVTPLANSTNDARAVASTLESIGFDVTLVIDAPLADLRQTMDDFAFRAETADLALIYFAGHGIEVQGENFLIPVDAQVASNLDVQRQSVSLDDFLAVVDSARKMRIVILDACRDNPFGDAIDLAATAEAAAQAEDGTRSAGPRGLAPVDPERGTLVAYAARDGQVALDGTGQNSPFARALMTKMAEPGLEVGLMFRQVRDMVLSETRNLQEPYSYGSLPSTPFYMAGAVSGEDDVSRQPDRAAAWSSLSVDQEEQFLTLAAQGDTRSLVGLGYMRLNPNDPEHDINEAKGYFERAAEAGSPEAQFELARIYEGGIGVEPDPARALELYQAAADQDYANALNELGFIHYQGLLGLQSDPELGITFFAKAAEARDPEAQYNMAALIDDGVVPGKGPADAAELLYQALRSGNERVLSVAPQMEEQFEPETRSNLQRILSEKGFYDGGIDGEIGPGTQAAMRRAFGLEEA